jgi:hypothetical protein
MINKNHPKILLVEGPQDKRVIPELMKKHDIPWQDKENPPVFINENGGYNKLVKKGVIATELDRSNLTALGIIIDADEYPDNRWQSIRNACLEAIPDIPKILPQEGLIHTTSKVLNLVFG